MEQRLEPGFFYGAAIAALIGLLFGLMLHTAWRKHPGGPQILLGSAAAQAVTPSANGRPADQPAPIQLAEQDAGPATPDPLPVTRLAPEMFDLQPAATGETARQDAADVVAGDDAPQPPPRAFD